MPIKYYIKRNKQYNIMALVSIVTPAYNCKNTIEGTYDSVLS